MLKTPAFFFPTTAYMLDDDQHFIQMLSLSLPSELNKIVFENSFELIEAIKKYYPLSVDAPDEARDLLPLNSLEKYKKFIELGFSRYLVSTVVIDHHLEDMDGTEVLKEISHTHVMKILISNFIDAKDVNRAYDEGLINTYIPKMNHDFINNLGKSILKLQKQFFVNLSKDIPEVSKNIELFSDEAFFDYFNNILETLKIKSYVFRPSISLFELTSANNNKKINLFVLTDQDFEDILNSIQAEDAPQRDIEKITKRQAFPCIAQEELPSGRDWDEHMQKVTLISGRKPFYVSCQANF